jgi:IS5 family transposase
LKHWLGRLLRDIECKLLGHLKSDHSLRRCFLRGLVGDALNAVGSGAAELNFRKLLNLLYNRKFYLPLTKITITTLFKTTIKQIWEKFKTKILQQYPLKNQIIK